MKTRTRIALGGVVMTFATLGLVVAAEAAEPPPHYQTRTTDKGCVFYDWVDPINVFTGEPSVDYSAGSTWTWNQPCESGQPISGTGTVFEVKSATNPSSFASVVYSGHLIGGYHDGPWPYTITRKDGTTDATVTPTYRMGCQVWDTGSKAGEISNPNCTPGVAEPGIAETLPPTTPGKLDGPQDGKDGGKDLGTPAAEGSAENGGASEPGGPDHVTEISEGGRETDRFIAARVSRERAPKHHPEHDMSNCLGKYLEEHVPPHNHYVLYNKCDAPINVVWCVMGTGSSCEAGSGQIANMNPRIGYVAGMEDSPGMKAGACSGKVWPIMENGQMAGYGCE